MRLWIFLCLTLLMPQTLLAQSHYEPTTPGSRKTPIVLAIEKASPAVVSVYAQVNIKNPSPFGSGSPFHDEFFNQFFDDPFSPRNRPGISLGSGVIVDGPKGLIVTNEHVVRGAASITIKMSDDREYPATILGADPDFDLAVLEVKSNRDLPELKPAQSDDLMIGETVIAIGNPFGLNHSATTGVISATDRTVPGSGANGPLHDLIQTDASINPGNSGGPLININGELVGINTAILARGEGLGFAIPSNRVKRVTQSLLRGSTQNLPVRLGLELVEAALKTKGSGCLVATVSPDSPAEKAGLKKGDMIISLDSSPTDSLAEYELIVGSLAAEKPVPITIRRGTQTQELTITPEALTNNDVLGALWNGYGLAFTSRQNFLVLSKPKPGSPAAQAGLTDGDILLAFAQTEATTIEALTKIAAKTHSKKRNNPNHTTPQHHLQTDT